MAGVLGVITRLRNPLLAPLRDSPKPRPTGVTRDDIFGSWLLDPGTLAKGRHGIINIPCQIPVCMVLNTAL